MSQQASTTACVHNTADDQCAHHCNKKRKVEGVNDNTTQQQCSCSCTKPDSDFDQSHPHKTDVVVSGISKTPNESEQDVVKAEVSESGPLSPPESEPPQHSKAEVIDLLTKLSKLLSKQDKFEKATQTAKKGVVTAETGAEFFELILCRAYNTWSSLFRPLFLSSQSSLAITTQQREQQTQIANSYRALITVAFASAPELNLPTTGSSGALFESMKLEIDCLLGLIGDDCHQFNTACSRLRDFIDVQAKSLAEERRKAARDALPPPERDSIIQICKRETVLSCAALALAAVKHPSKMLWAKPGVSMLLSFAQERPDVWTTEQLEQLGELWKSLSGASNMNRKGPEASKFDWDSRKMQQSSVSKARKGYLC